MSAMDTGKGDWAPILGSDSAFVNSRDSCKSMRGWLAGWLAGWLDGWMDGWMDGMHAWMHGRINEGRKEGIDDMSG